MNTYRRFPLVFTRGEGTRLWDVEGRSYLDFIAGIAVCSLGHSHPRVVGAIRAQAGRLMHVSNLYHIDCQIALAEQLVAHSFADRAFFCNSGAEANEGAIKLARKYGREKMGGRYEILTMRDSFHGRTLATVAATAQEKFQEGFAPLTPGFSYAPFDDVEALEKAVTPQTCAVLLEPIQGEGGVRIPRPGYLRAVRRLCDERGILMILDEVQTGMGRTGTLFACDREGVAPDILTLAKALGNGFPVGAVLATEQAAAAFTPGSHGSTFGGNPLAMAAGLATLEVLREDGFLEHVRERGASFLGKLKTLQQRHPVVREVRGRGLLLGMELDREGADIVRKAMEQGILINCTSNTVLRFAPPLIVTEAETDCVVSVLDEILGAC